MYYEIGKDEHGLARAPFKSIAVPRPIAWLSTISPDGKPNLAPYSQFTNLNFNPPYIAISVNEGGYCQRKDTTNNIETTGEFVHNMVTYDLMEKMNITAEPFPAGVDEFEMAGLTKAESKVVKPYRVAESPIQLECKYVQTIRIPSNNNQGAADLIIGKVVAIHIKDEFIMPNGKIDILKIKPLARMGYSDYTYVSEIFEMKLTKMAGDRPDLDAGLEGALVKK